MIEFDVLGTPKGQPRVRAFSRGGHARVYDPGTAEGWKSEIAIAARAHIPKAPLEGALELSLCFRFLRPKSHFLKRGLRPGAPWYHTAKPDIDNLIKTFDALTTLGFWLDDAQVAVVYAQKLYITREGGPGCFVRLRQLLNAF